MNPLYMVKGKKSPFYFCANIMKTESWSLALKVTARITGWIAFPVIIGMFLGKWLDQKYGTEPWLLLATIGVSFVVSMVGLIKETLKEFKNIDKEYSAKKAENIKAEKKN